MEDKKTDIWDSFSGFLEKENAIRTALTLFDWDNETLAPEAASEKTAKAYGALSAVYQEKRGRSFFLFRRKNTAVFRS